MASRQYVFANELIGDRSERKLDYMSDSCRVWRQCADACA